MNNFPLPTILTAHLYLQGQGMGGGRGWAAVILYNTSLAVPAFTWVTMGRHLTQAQPSLHPGHLESMEGKGERFTDKQTITLSEAGLVRADMIPTAWI